MKLIYENDFMADTGEFLLEGKGSCRYVDGTLELDDTISQSGLTLWLKRSFHAPLCIRYEAQTVPPEMANNINLFFMAVTLNGKDIASETHSGDYQEYHRTCRMYGFTFTGKSEDESWSRLRKDPGFHLLSEDRSAKCRVSKVYQLEVIVRKQVIQCRIDGRVVHHMQDPEPYLQGSIGFRTWSTKLRIRHFQVFALEE